MKFSNLIKMTKKYFLLIIIIFSPLICSLANAQGSDSLEILYSEGFDDPGKEEQAVATFKHSRTWSIGDNFYFFDLTNLGDFENDGGLYFEWGPRLSPGKLIANRPLSFGLIKDIYLIGELDYVHNKHVEKAIYLTGVSLDLGFPGFQFFKLHLMNRNDPTIPGHTQLLTMSWDYPFSLGGRDFSFEGYYDAVPGEGNRASYYLTQPQLVWRMHEKISLGIEYSYWHNKNGIAGFNESALQGMLRINF